MWSFTIFICNWTNWGQLEAILWFGFFFTILYNFIDEFIHSTFYLKIGNGGLIFQPKIYMNTKLSITGIIMKCIVVTWKQPVEMQCISLFSLSLSEPIGYHIYAYKIFFLFPKLGFHFSTFHSLLFLNSWPHTLHLTVFDWLEKFKSLLNHRAIELKMPHWLAVFI